MIEATFQPGTESVSAYGLWQYDYNQDLVIHGLDLPAVIRIDFSLSSTNDGSAIPVDGVTTDGVTVARIPNILLQAQMLEDYRIYAFLYVIENDTGETVRKIRMPVKARPKPDGQDTPVEQDAFSRTVETVSELTAQAQESAGNARESAESAGESLEAIREIQISISESEDNAKASENSALTSARNAATSEENAAGYARDAESAAQQAGQSVSTIPQTINAALEQAKESGEFKGDKGDTGEQGPRGEQGPQGPKGNDGYTPVKGVDYFDGQPGDTGEAGNGIASTVLNADYTLTLTFTDGTSYTTPSIRGEQGIQGIQGPKGEKGDTGEQGADLSDDVIALKEDLEDVMHPKTPAAHPMNAFNQTLYDSFSATHNGVLLRSDIVVPNQFCVGSYEGLDELSIRSCEKSGSDNTTFDYGCFYWNKVQTNEDSYDFSDIYKYLAKMKRQGRRCALRLFPSCYSSSAIDYDGYKISFPPYIVDIMRDENAQFTAYENHLMIDVNLDSVYDEWKKLWEKFSEWVYNTDVDGIPAIQLILYVDIGLAGPWGEGGWYSFQITTSADNIVRYYSVILNLLPDTQLNVGKMYKEGTYDKNAIFVSVKELKNNVGYVGFFTDNIGSKNPQIDVNNIKVLEDGTKIWDLLDKYVKRGDFICGEFAMFDGSDYWGGEAGLWALERVRRLKMSAIKATNITLQLNDRSIHPIKIKDISPYINYVISSAIAIVGARFVITPFSFIELEDGKAKITWNISNIGTNTCRFDIFDVYYRVRNLDTGEYTDVKTNINLCDIAPYGEAMVYSINNGITVTHIIDTLYENYEIDLIALDKLDLQVPMYFSNYGRKDDGSYPLFPNSVKDTYIDNIASRIIELEKTVKELHEENKCFRDNVGIVTSVTLTGQYSVEDAANLPIHSLTLYGNTSQDSIPTLSNQVIPVSVTNPVISIGDTSVTIKGTYRGIDDNSDVLLWDGLKATIIRKCAEETVTISEGSYYRHSLTDNRIFIEGLFKNIYLTAGYKSMLSFAKWSSYAMNTQNNCGAVGKSGFYYRGNDGAGFETLEEGLGTLLGKTITIVGQLETAIIEEVNDKDVITALKTLATVSGSNIISIVPTAKTTIKYYFDIKKYIDSKIN